LVQVNSQNGYTLVEVLIAMVILLSLMFTANYSYSLYSNYWVGRLGTFDRTVFYYQGLLQIKETIDASIPYIVTDSKQTHTFYFLGRSEGFTLVTTAPVFAQTVNDAAVIRIFKEKTETGYQLVYEEAPLSDRLLFTLDQELDFKYRTVLMRTEQLIDFEYYGWKLREHKYSRNTFPTESQQWTGSYDAALTRVQPGRVRMTIGGQALEYDLPAGHDKLINFYLRSRD
jgi:prepilin-type N-terminal cleavage/methylation domain-containing protein